MCSKIGLERQVTCQGHTADEWKIRNWNSGDLTLESTHTQDNTANEW